MPGLQVEAIGGTEEGQTVGYYGERRRRAGEKFFIEQARHFSHRWMKAIGWEPPPPRDMPMSREDMLIHMDEKYSFKDSEEIKSQPADSTEPSIEEDEPRPKKKKKKRAPGGVSDGPTEN